MHQIELEMQNEELRREQVELDAVWARYFDLYDLAPVGYCTISEKGLILEVNFTCATLLCVARAALVKQPITRFILKEDQDIYYLHFKQLLKTCEPLSFELRMMKTYGALFWVHLAIVCEQDSNYSTEYRTVLSDITGRRTAEEIQRRHTVELEIRNVELSQFNRPAVRIFLLPPSSLFSYLCANAMIPIMDDVIIQS